MLASHPNISMVRRTNMWRYFYHRYGDLSDPGNFEHCLTDMARYSRMRHLKPDPERIRREFQQGQPTYGRLFALFHRHNAERLGKSRWGDKSLHAEHFAGQIIAEFPDAKIVHMSRDPRDRYASVRKRHGQDSRRVGAATARWLISMQAARHNLKHFPGNYHIVQFEILASQPESTAREVCEFIEEPFSPTMLTLQGAQDYQDRGANSSFGTIEQGVISTRPIGRYREVLSNEEIAFIQTFCKGAMKAFGYPFSPVKFSPKQSLKYYLYYLPVNLARMLGWMTLTKIRLMRGSRVPASRLLDEPILKEQKVSI